MGTCRVHMPSASRSVPSALHRPPRDQRYARQHENSGILLGVGLVCVCSNSIVEQMGCGTMPSLARQQELASPWGSMPLGSAWGGRGNRRSPGVGSLAMPRT